MSSLKTYSLFLQVVFFLIFIIKVDSNFAQSPQAENQLNFSLNDLAPSSTVAENQEPSDLDTDQELQKSLIAILPLDSQQIIPEMCLIGDPDNLPDPTTGLGSVSETFRIGKYETTIGQWLRFTSAVTQHGDPHALIKKELFTDDNISFLPHLMELMKNSLSSGHNDILNAPETIRCCREELALPITYVTLDDAKRYCNWLHHGAPSGDAVTEETTETGAYEFRNGHHGEQLSEAMFFIPTLNQWYKAAYHKQGAQEESPFSYWNFPFQKDGLKDRDLVPQEANFATLGWFSNSYNNKQPPYLTPVNQFDNNSSPYGLCDMGGNVREWTCDYYNSHEAFAPGGSWNEDGEQLHKFHANQHYLLKGGSTIGFRIAAPAVSSALNSLL